MEIIKNPDQIKFKIQDIDGKEHELIVISINRKKMKEFTEATKEIETNKDNIYDYLVKQLSFFTGKEESFFDNFHISVIGTAVTYISGELQRPFLKMQQPGSS